MFFLYDCIALFFWREIFIHSDLIYNSFVFSVSHTLLEEVSCIRDDYIL